jgi:hypothetical protein
MLSREDHLLWSLIDEPLRLRKIEWDHDAFMNSLCEVPHTDKDLLVDKAITCVDNEWKGRDGPKRVY